MKSKVVLLPIDEYDEGAVTRALEKGFDLLGGVNKLFSPEEKILLKLNLVRSAKVDRAVTTHPMIVTSVAKILKKNGVDNISAGDSPGFDDGVKIMDGIGVKKPLEEMGVRMAEFTDSKVVTNPLKPTEKFVIAEDVLNSDGVISLPRMKTHALEYITGAVKNQYGCIVGTNKAIGHTKYTTQESFGRMLVDLNLIVKPRLFILDGIVAMEGNGPTSGDPVNMKVVLMGQDPIAIDSVFCNLINLDPEIVPTIFMGKERGLGEYEGDKIQILTPEGEISMEEAVKLYGKSDFKVIRKKQTSKGLMGLITKLNAFKRRPYIKEDRCVKCGECVKGCPVEGKAIQFKNGRDNPPVYNYRKCIKCFICQEMCPHKAIGVKGRK